LSLPLPSFPIGKRSNQDCTLIKWASASNPSLGQSHFHGAVLEGEYCLENSESNNPFGIFLGCVDAWGTAWEKALRRFGEF
jgi:hypothetical protein